MTDEPIEEIPIEPGVDDVPINKVDVDGLLPTDSLFQAGDVFVKVRIVVEPMPEYGVSVLTVSGSECDDEGWAQKTDGGLYMIAPAQRETIQSARAVDFVSLIENIQHSCVKVILRARKVYQGTVALKEALGQTGN